MQSASMTGLVSVPHPKAAMFASKRAERLAMEKAKREHTENAETAHGLHYVHVRSVDYHSNGVFSFAAKGGITVAYAFSGYGRRFIEVACAYCHANDSYCKREGRFQAAHKFDRGETMTIRVPKNKEPVDVIKVMFSYLLDE
jgi:hypothetical protein